VSREHFLPQISLQSDGSGQANCPPHCSIQISKRIRKQYTLILASFMLLFLYQPPCEITPTGVLLQSSSPGRYLQSMQHFFVPVKFNGRGVLREKPKTDRAKMQNVRSDMLPRRISRAALHAMPKTVGIIKGHPLYSNGFRRMSRGRGWLISFDDSVYSRKSSDVHV
jgi:hypothetical protein